MGLLSRKPKMGIEEFCREFYDTYIFHPIKLPDGEDIGSAFWNSAFNFVVEADQSFALIDRAVFRREMTALRLELLALAWGHKFKREKFTIPQSVFTRRYLEENEKFELWEIMGEYNQVVAQSATANKTGEQVSGRTGRALVTFVNMTRSNMWEDWCKANLKDTSNLSKEEEASLQSVARVINRFGADIKREDCVLPKMLSSKLLDRVGYKPRLAVEAAFRISAVIFGFYEGTKETIKSVNLQS